MDGAGVRTTMQSPHIILPQQGTLRRSGGGFSESVSPSCVVNMVAQVLHVSMIYVFRDDVSVCNGRRGRLADLESSSCTAERHKVFDTSGWMDIAMREKVLAFLR